jgi:NAD(P)H-hydrate epimerase
MDGITLDERAALVDHLTGLGLSTDVLAEVSGFALATVVRDQLTDGAARVVTVVVGPRIESLPAIVAARRLLTWSERPIILTTAVRTAFPAQLDAAAATFEALGGSVYEPGAPLPATALWIDAIGNEPAAQPLPATVRELIETMNHAHRPIVSLEVPTGLDPTTGKAAVPTVRATTTLALGRPLTGLLKPFASPLVGELLVTDLGVPASVWRASGVSGQLAWHGQPYQPWPLSTSRSADAHVPSR